MLFKKKKKEIEVKEGSANYDKDYEIAKLKIMVIIVNRGQGDYFVRAFEKKKVAATFKIFGTGTATKEIYEILGIGETKKDIVMSLVKTDEIEPLKEIVKSRFEANKKFKGISFCIDIDSVAGVLVYKYLANVRENKRRNDNGRKQKELWINYCYR